MDGVPDYNDEMSYDHEKEDGDVSQSKGKERVESTDQQ